MTDPDTSGSPPDSDLIRAVWEEARDLVRRLEGSTVQRFRVEAGEYKIEIERGMPEGAVIAAVPVAGGELAAGEDVAAEADGRHPIVSPLVGTFYRASQPGAKAFVEEGDVVDAGQTVGIVEAMKLMNQVKADEGGKIAQIVAKDGDWVEFEQVLMYLGPAGE
jgi:acetyl-CoA carboxylase biotin carboxyl carrier protein